MKTVYVCGDSFGASDPDYGDNWVDLLSQYHNVTNLCQVAASNLLISQQVDLAISKSPEYIIVLFTSSTRGETQRNGETIPFSWLTASSITTPFSPTQLKILQEYFTEFHSIDLAIYTNRCIIESTLYRLKQSGIRFIFDQGGFEHPSMGATTKYFLEYTAYCSQINLWNFARTREYRPYYHITDANTHKQIADYFIKQIQ